MKPITEALKDLASGAMTVADAVAAYPRADWKAYEVRSASDAEVAAYWMVLEAMPPASAQVIRTVSDADVAAYLKARARQGRTVDVNADNEEI